MKVYKTVNSFNQTPSAAQILAYVIFAGMLALFYAIVQRKIQSAISFLVLHVLFGICNAGQLICTLLCSLIDPSDRVMVAHHSNQEEYSSF